MPKSEVPKHVPTKCAKPAAKKRKEEVMPPPDERRPFWPKPRDGYLLAVNFAVLFGWMLATDYFHLKGWAYWVSGLIPMFGCWMNERLAERWFGPKQPLS